MKPLQISLYLDAWLEEKKHGLQMNVGIQHGGTANEKSLQEADDSALVFRYPERRGKHGLVGEMHGDGVINMQE